MARPDGRHGPLNAFRGGRVLVPEQPQAAVVPCPGGILIGGVVTTNGAIVGGSIVHSHFRTIPDPDDPAKAHVKVNRCGVCGGLGIVQIDPEEIKVLSFRRMQAQAEREEHEAREAELQAEKEASEAQQAHPRPLTFPTS